MESITSFVAQILPEYSLSLTAEVLRKLTEYIIKDILQKHGEMYAKV